MSKETVPPSSSSQPGRRAKQAPSTGQETRQDRLKAALKANMARRKAQARARAADDGGPDNET